MTLVVEGSFPYALVERSTGEQLAAHARIARARP